MGFRTKREKVEEPEVAKTDQEQADLHAERALHWGGSTRNMGEELVRAQVHASLAVYYATRALWPKEDENSLRGDPPEEAAAF